LTLPNFPRTLRDKKSEAKFVSIQFTDIAEPFAEKGLKLPNLNVLTPDARAYEVLAIQPVGVIDPRNDFVGHANRELAEGKFTGFIALAVEKKADLVLCPEYSCPWEVLEAAILQGKFPAVGKLWVLGCESITPAKFREFTASFPDIVWIHEELPNMAGDFLGVVCYLLKTESNAGAVKDIIVVQFKTVPMGGNDTSEADHLLCGQQIYFLRNQNDHIRFATIICSEAYAFQLDDDVAQEFDQHPYIIFHPQLTNDPRHMGVRKYRNDLYFHNCSRDLEVIALNWARGTKIAAQELSRYGNSAIFMKSDKFNRSDDRLHQNHLRGIYYCHWHVNRTELCIFNFDEHIFHYRTQKNRFLGAGVGPKRTGPEMLKLWRWHNENWQESTEADDGFHQLCHSFGNLALNNCTTVVDRERLLTLSSGKLEPALDWHKVEKLNSFVAEADERSKRLTFAQEQNIDSVNFRYDHLSNYIRLQNVILPNEANFPPNILDLSGNWQLRPPQENSAFRFNLDGVSAGTPRATAIFVGHRPLSYVLELWDKFDKAWRNKENERGEEKARRLVIWYEDAEGNPGHVYKPLATFTDDPELRTSITKSERQ
jgi:hypothetical protein